VFEVTMVLLFPTKLQLAFTLELLCGSVWNRFHICGGTMHQERAHCQEEKVKKKLCVSFSGVQDASFGIWRYR